MFSMNFNDKKVDYFAYVFVTFFLIQAISVIHQLNQFVEIPISNAILLIIQLVLSEMKLILENT